jgi:hypothetical protein
VQELLDEYGDKFKGKLICLGSHTSELRRMVTAGNEPLYGRGFYAMTITPTNPSTVCKLLQQVIVSVYVFVLWCACGGVNVCVHGNSIYFMQGYF